MTGCRSSKGPTQRDRAEVARFAELLGKLGPARRDADGNRRVTRDEAAALADYHADDPEVAEHFRRLAEQPPPSM